MEDNKLQSNKAGLAIKNEVSGLTVAKAEEKLIQTCHDNNIENRDYSKCITSAEATAAMKILGTFLMQSDINADDLLLHSRFNDLVMSKFNKT